VNPLVSIVIPAFNKWAYTAKCLAALAENTRDVAHEVIVIDNASSDQTAQALARMPGLRLHRNAENLGFARASNQGAAMARGTYLLFLNNDTEPTPGWLAPMVAELQRDPAVAIVGSKLLYPDGTIQHGGVIFSYAGPEPITPLHLHCRQPAAASAERLELRAVTAACLLIRPEVFRDAGGFDEAFVNGGEDVDLCLKVWSSGRKIVYTPHSVVVHHESISDGRFRFAAANADRLNRLWIDRFDAFDVDFRKFARPLVVDPGRPAASVIVVVHDALWTVAPCLENIRYTLGPQDELIVVDDGSRGAAAPFMAQLAARHPNQIRLLRNPAPLGFSRAAARGLELASQPYAALVASGTRVVGDWIDRLRAHLEARPNLAIVSPVLGDSATLQAAELLYPIQATDPGRWTDAARDGSSSRSSNRSPDGSSNRSPEPAAIAPAPAPRLAPGDVEPVRFPPSLCLFGRRELLQAIALDDPEIFFADDLGALAEQLADNHLELACARDVVVYKLNQNAPNGAARLRDRYLAEQCAPGGDARLVTIVVQVGQRPERTRACLDAIARHTEGEVEVLMIGGPRRDGALAELSSMRGEYVAILGDDAIVTDGWLRRQIALLGADPTLGVVGPAMSESPGPQRVGMVTYRRLDELPAFAAQWALEHRAEHAVVTPPQRLRLDPLCRVIARRALIAAGGIDGGGDHDDLSGRVGSAGLKVGIAFDAFVHRQAP
jgi:GT2 family glycosyltransferase